MVKVNLLWGAQRQRDIEEQKRKTLDVSEEVVLEGPGRLLFDYGGWFNTMYNHYGNLDNDKSTEDALENTYTADMRLWFKAVLRPADYNELGGYEHSFYLRLKDLYTGEFPEDTAGGYDHDGPHIDNAYAVLDFSPFWIEAGRRYFNVGRGIAYSDVSDGIQFNYLVPGLNLGAFVSHTLPHQDNIDTSVPGYDKNSDRYFYGLGLGYTKIKNHQLYGYALGQSDFSNESPTDAVRQYIYHSQYYGVGALGNLDSKTQYWIEIIKEEGKSCVYDSSEKKDVDAWAVDLGITHKFDFYGHPSLSFEYAFGKGDEDRLSVTNTEDGNTVGGDNNFLYFGYINTGLALSPRLSNLHLYRLGFDSTPFEKISYLNKIKVGFDYLHFFKDKSDGGIYDSEATDASKYIGNEIDFNINWQVVSDIDLTVEYGLFMPGDAYSASANDNESFLSVSVTHLF